jgi:hypothetical protein
MKTLRHALWLFLCAFLGCGQQLVEVPLGSAPTVAFTDPVEGSIGVPIGTAVKAVFSTTMDAATLNAGTFTLTQDGAAVAAQVSYAGTTATLTPEAALATNTLFTARVTTGAKDEDGISLAADYVWTFTTRDTFTEDVPTVIFTSPEDGATAVPLNGKVSAAFSEPMDSATLNAASFTLSQGATPVLGAVSYSGTTVMFTPTSPFAPSTLFTATLTASVTDLSGAPLAADYVWTFTTGAGVDETAPTVTFTSPVNDAVDVPLSATVQVAFDEPMDCTTLDGTSVTLTDGGASVLGAVTCLGATVTLAPSAPLTAQTLYTGTVTTGAQDLAGNALAADYVWTFTTGSDADLSPPVVVFTNPPNNANGVDIAAPIHAAFDAPVDCVTVDITTFTPDAGPLAGPRDRHLPGSGGDVHSLESPAREQRVHGQAQHRSRGPRGQPHGQRLRLELSDRANRRPGRRRSRRSGELCHPCLQHGHQREQRGGPSSRETSASPRALPSWGSRRAWWWARLTSVT